MDMECNSGCVVSWWLLAWSVGVAWSLQSQCPPVFYSLLSWTLQVPSLLWAPVRFGVGKGHPTQCIYQWRLPCFSSLLELPFLFCFKNSSSDTLDVHKGSSAKGSLLAAGELIRPEAMRQNKAISPYFSPFLLRIRSPSLGDKPPSLKPRLKIFFSMSGLRGELLSLWQMTRA